MKKVAFLLGILSLLATSLHSQSASVFDAAYFNKDNTEPPLRVGKGFHVNDVYKQTQFCFTPESCNKSKLVRQQSGSKTSINLFYTKDEEEYNSLKTKGISGKVSFLNLFSLGGSKLKEHSVKENNETERIVFVAKVDFGVENWRKLLSWRVMII